MSPNSRIYGSIPGVRFGQKFKNRDELMASGVHAPSQAGIHGDSNDDDGGAFSICISEGYEDNEDRGERITYVGSGGQDSRRQQVANQTWDDPPNKALQLSFKLNKPVRVIRGKNKSSYYAPTSGYRYDGLYRVTSAEMREGKQGYRMCFFELRRERGEGDGALPNRRLLTLKKMSNMVKRARKK